MKERHDMDDPNEKASNIEKLLPNLDRPYTDTALPIRA
jgi:hypothetical protein